MSQGSAKGGLGARVARMLRRRGLGELALMLFDRAVRPFGISPISFSRFAAIQPPSAGDEVEVKFEEIATSNLWGSSESLSGKGSELRQSARYRKELVALLRDREFRSVFDAPCGDMNWMRLVLEEVSVTYSGGDISRHIVEANRRAFPHLDFVEFDIRLDEFPGVDVWHCRDCLFHLSYSDISKALANFSRSEIPYVLVTNHTALLRNVDVATGGWRYLNLERAPFNFPPPELYLTDYRFGDLPRRVGLWTRETIANALATAAL